MPAIMSWKAFAKGLSVKGLAGASFFVPKNSCAACVKGLSKGLAGSGFFAKPVASAHCCIMSAKGLADVEPAPAPGKKGASVCLKRPPISALAMTGSICL